MAATALSYATTMMQSLGDAAFAVIPRFHTIRGLQASLFGKVVVCRKKQIDVDR
jgi:hypothetical protein